MAVLWRGGGAVYDSSGTYTSAAYDAGYPVAYGNISWAATTPAGTAIKFQIAANTDNTTWDYLGPDGTPSTYYETSDTAIWSGLDDNRYISYRAFLSTVEDGYTPVLAEVSLGYSQPSILPVVTTGEETLVEETTATLHGTVTDDGGEACQVRFQYGESPGAYSVNTTWEAGITTGGSFNADITGLGKGTKYYFRAQVNNSEGLASGIENNLLTKPEPPINGTFTAATSDGTQVELTWTMGDGAEHTLIRRKIGDYPVDRDDGVQVYFGTDTSFTDTGLTPETTYYYRAWSEVTGSQQWSDGYRDTVVTTGSGVTVPPPTPHAIGGVVYPVNRAAVLAPWLVAFCAGSIVLSMAVWGWKRRYRFKG